MMWGWLDHDAKCQGGCWLVLVGGFNLKNIYVYFGESEEDFRSGLLFWGVETKKEASKADF